MGLSGFILLCLLMVFSLGCADRKPPFRLVQMQNGEYMVQKRTNSAIGIIERRWVPHPKPAFPNRYATEEEGLKALNQAIKDWIAMNQAHTVHKVVRP